jgi:hypothetical protein
MTQPTDRPGPDPHSPVRAGLLSGALRRDLMDLNAQYLELGLTPGAQEDPRFCWSEPVRRCLLAAGVDTRSRMAAAPFALFGLALSTACMRAADSCVQDARPPDAAAGRVGPCESFAHQAVFLARRMADGEPMVLQLVLGLPQEAQRWLGDCRPGQLAELAGNPRLIRPRWRLHARFWEMLAAAARRGTPTALQWAHCVGMALLGAADADAAASAARRRPRG